MYQVCKTCLTNKPLTDYFKSGKSSSSYEANCKKCSTERKKQRALLAQQKLNTLSSKQCKTCNLVLDISEFHKNSHKLDGYSFICRTCTGNKRRKPPKPTFPEGYKECSKCKEVLAKELFYPDITKKDGFHTRCRACHNGLTLEKRREEALKHEVLAQITHKECMGCQQVLEIESFREKTNKQYRRDIYCEFCRDKLTETVKKRRNSGDWFDCETDEYIKNCNTCEESKTLEDFGVLRTSFDGRSGKCLSCTQKESKIRKQNNKALDAYHSRMRQAQKRNAVPKWANFEEMLSIYEKAQELRDSTKIKYVVDHVVPLQHPLVCGLHVETNLRPITAKENGKKSNYFKPFSVDSSGTTTMIQFSSAEKEELRLMVKQFKAQKDYLRF